MLARNIRTRRMIALGMIPLVGAFIWAALVWPVWYTWDSQQEWRTTSARSLARSRAIAASEAMTRDQVKSLPQSPLAAKFYVAGTNGAGANAFQADVRGMLGSVGAVAQTATPIATNKLGAISRLGLRVTTSMTIDQLKNFLARVDSHSRYMRIDQLDITAPSVQPRDQNPMLTVSMELAAFESERAPSGATFPKVAQLG